MDTGDRYRFIILAILVVGLLGMGFIFGLGEVKEATSYGLPQVITVLSLIAYEGAKWAFKVATKESEKPPEKPEPSESKPPENPATF